MNAVKEPTLISEADYLAGELVSTSLKHEYLGGVLYPMAGASIAHSRIAGSIVLAALDQRLRDGPCEAFNSDTKIRIRLPLEILLLPGRFGHVSSEPAGRFVSG